MIRPFAFIQREQTPVGDLFTIPSPLDGLLKLPIIGRNHEAMNQIFSLSLIIVVLVVLIIEGLFSVRMATVRVK
jgi:hypothetical protein